MTDVIPTSIGQPEPETEFDRLHRDLQRARAETVGDAPLIQESVDPNLTLTRGLMHNGTWQDRVLVRELNGIDEETLSRVRDQAEIYDTMLALGTMRIGNIEFETLSLGERQGLLQQLLIGERDQLFIAIVKATYGDRKTMRYTCQNEDCKVEQDLIVTLSEDFPIRAIDNPMGTEFLYTTAKGQQILYRPAIGSDQMEALRRKNATNAEQNSVLLSRCIKTVDGQLVVDPLLFARQLPLRDRQALLDALISRQPSVDMTITIDCVECRQEQVIALGWGDIFRP